MTGGSPDIATEVVGCLVFLCLIAFFGAARRSSTAVRLALRDPDPETRRAAVLVAARHGLAHHAGLLASHVRYEFDEDVLFTLARVVRDDGCPGRGGRAELRRWSAAFLSQSAASESPQRTEESPVCSYGHDLGLAVDGIDALELFEVEPLPASPAGGGNETLRRAPPWRAAPGHLDAMAVLASLDGPPPTKTTTTPSRHNTREPERRVDYEALVDRLAGIAPKRREQRSGDDRTRDAPQVAGQVA